MTRLIRIVALVAVLALALAGCSGPSSNALELRPVERGDIYLNEPVIDRLESLYDTHDWNFSGAEGQVVTIRAEAVPGDDTDPRINLVDNSGGRLAEDDDGGGGYDAQISDYRLPYTGNYVIKIDVFTGGEYELVVR